jgi:hypothetical protein
MADCNGKDSIFKVTLIDGSDTAIYDELENEDKKEDAASNCWILIEKKIPGKEKITIHPYFPRRQKIGSNIP